jgi:hypothetical protein
MKKIAFPFFLFCTLSVNAQSLWPTITKTNKPWTRWWWQGSAVNKKDLTAAMQQYQAAGLGGLEITPIYGVKGHESEFIDFLISQMDGNVAAHITGRKKIRPWHRYGQCNRLAVRRPMGNACRCM